MKWNHVCLLLALIAAWSWAEPRPYALVIHGGAGADPKVLEPAEMAAIQGRIEQVLKAGLAQLGAGASSVDVVEQAVRSLEDDPWFNAGRGAALNSQGEAELDAAIMDGRTLACGSVAGIRHLRNPISLARRVMEATPHVLMVGEGADRFGQAQGLEWVDNDYFITERARLSLRKKQGTVGCVALDQQGHLAAATSTGGLTNKLPGRVGDSPIIGAGTLADDRCCAISCTGVGEEFIRHQVAGQIAWRMRLNQVSLAESVRQTFADGLPLDVGGVIGLTPLGEWVLHFNTPGMARGAADSRGRVLIGIGPEEQKQWTP